MSVYINMEMPKDCPMCPLSHWDFTGEFRGCKVVNGKKYAMETEPGYPETNFRPSWCPLLHVPEHGRLIDADALCKVLQRNAEDEWNKNVAPFSWSYAYECVKDTVDNMPTIIPAEEGQ